MLYAMLTRLEANFRLLANMKESSKASALAVELAGKISAHLVLATTNTHMLRHACTNTHNFIPNFRDPPYIYLSVHVG